MAIFKNTFIFRAGANGWSELWYQDRTDIRDCVQAATNAAGARQKLLGAQATLEAVRISSIDRPFRSYIFPVALDWNSQLGVADTAWNTIYARIDDTGKVYHRILQLRGVPDSWIIRKATDGSFDVDSSEVNGPLKNYIQSLKTNLLRFAARDQSGAAGTETPVTAFSREAGTDRLKATVALGGVAVGSFVTFSEVTGPDSSFAKGRHKVVANDGAVLTLATVLPAAVNPLLWAGGKVRPYVRGYFFPDIATPLRVSHRDTGRRFFVTRGRRPKAKK